MNDANPPTFQLSGSGRLIFFTVYEPVRGRPSIDDPKMWEIRPTDENLISKLPAITYGVVPPGFKQTIPAAGGTAASPVRETCSQECVNQYRTAKH